MITIDERCKTLLTSLTQHEDRVKQRDTALEFAARRQEIAQSARALSDAVAHATTLLRGRKLLKRDLPALETARESLKTIRERLAQAADASDLTKGNDYTKLRNRLQTLAADLEKQAAQEWELIKAEQQSIEEAYLKQVETVPGEADKVARLRGTLKSLKAAAGTMPGTKEELDHYFQLARATHEQLAALDPKQFPAAVLRFFRESQSPAGAPFVLLTDEVCEWLKAKGMLDRLRLRFQPDAGNARRS